MEKKGKIAAYEALMKLGADGLVDVTKVRSKLRKKEYVCERRWCAEVLRAQGFSLPEIGFALKRDHTTILSLLRRDHDTKSNKGETENASA